MTDVKGYRFPEVSTRLAREASGGSPRAEPETLTDPATGRTIEPAAYSHATILKRRAPGATSEPAARRSDEWKARAERVLGRDRHAIQAVIGGMPSSSRRTRSMPGTSGRGTGS
jgi:hypothetical protein